MLQGTIEEIFILETTSRACGQNIDKLVEIQNKLRVSTAKGITICISWTPSAPGMYDVAKKVDFHTLIINELAYNMKNGLKSGVMPVGIGEIDLDVYEKVIPEE